MWISPILLIFGYFMPGHVMPYVQLLYGGPKEPGTDIKVTELKTSNHQNYQNSQSLEGRDSTETMVYPS